MKRAISLLLLIAVGLTTTAQVSRTWIRQSSGVPTSCPSRTITINTLTDILYVPNGSGGCDAAASAGGISGLTTGQNVTAASATTVQTDGIKRYEAVLTQTSTNAPVATVHRNTTGVTFTWARTGAGVYTMTADSGTPFTADKTGIIIGPAIPGVAGSANIAQATRTSTSIITVQTTFQDGAGADGGVADSRLTETLIEVRIYP